MKMWRWSNAANRRMCFDSSIALPKTSPDMSPMPGDREVLRLGVEPELAEVAPHRLPAAARRDAHFLVVVPCGAAGREGVAEPEPVLLGDRIGDVGELRRALVGRDDQVGVVAVVPHDARRGHDLAADDVVRHVEQGADEVR